MTLPTVALIGRQNVGKSTLFNALIEERRAVVSRVAGTTRDRNIARVHWQGREWFLVDTGGIEEAPKDVIAQSVRRQAEYAAHHADVVCFLVDGQYGLTREDLLISGMLRASGKPVIVAINKLDSPRDRDRAPHELTQLGFQDAVMLSAKNGTGTGDLLDALLKRLPTPPETADRHETKLILIGKPNVGKSSIINRILGEERVIVSEIPHTTRDPQDTLFQYFGRTFRLIDTAGIRRQAKRFGRISKELTAKIEMTSIEKSLAALRRADVAAIVIDVAQPITKQDRQLVQHVEAAGAGIVLVANKWDAIPKKDVTTQRQYERMVRAAFPFLDWAPILFVSAKTGQRIRELLNVSGAIADARATRLTERSLERFMKHAIEKRKPPRTNNVATRLLSLTQIGIEPPAFRLIVGPRQMLPTAYRRYIINEIRNYYRLVGTNIQLRVEQQLRT